MRFRFRLLIWLFAIYSIACLAAAIFLAHVTLHPYRRPLSSDAENEMRHIAFDSAPLRAWFIHPRHGSGDSVILLHGLGDNRLGTVGYAQVLLDHGYSVLMPDARAHGVSGGIYATYGLLERDDISVTTSAAGSNGSKPTSIRNAFSDWESPWEPHSSCNPSTSSRVSVP